MRTALLALAAFGVLWILVVPRPGEHGRTDSEWRAAHQHGLRAAQLELALHDELSQRVIEIEAHRILERGDVASVKEARRLAWEETAATRREIQELIRLYQQLLSGT